jgi:hypothetical protein
VPRLPLLALALAVLATASAPLARADGTTRPAATVTIAPSNGGATRTLDLTALTDRFDVHGATYTLRDADGTKTTTTVADGISVGALLDAAGIARDAFGYLTVPGSNGASALVIADDVAGTDQGLPVVWNDAQGVHFLRPMRNDRDVNAEDLVTVTDGPLTLQLGTGDPVKPQASISTLRPQVGDPVVFSATLAVGALRPGWGYAWYLGDGSGLIPGATITHRFRRAGTYPTQVNVVDASGTTIGPAGIVYLHVAAARPRPAHGAHGAGDSRGGGAGTGTSSGGTGSGSGSGTGTNGSDTTAPAYVPSATPPAVSPPPAPVPSDSRAPAPRPRPRGDLVSGTLIASASAAATPAGGAPAARAVEHSATSDGPLHVPIGVWVAIGLALLLALGWVLESRHTLPFWQP